MNSPDLHTIFRVVMDKNAEGVAYGGCPAFLPEEEDLFLNQAYIEIICNKFTGTNSKQIPFELSVKRIADLQKLIKTDRAQLLIYPYSASNVLVLKDFFKDKDASKRLFYVECVLHFGEESATCILTDHDKAKAFLQTYNNIPWIENPIATIGNNDLEIYIDPLRMTADSYTVDITYVKYPTKIDYKNNADITEVPEYVLYEVVNRAVVLALEDIESKRAESKLQLNTLSE